MFKPIVLKKPEVIFATAVATGDKPRNGLQAQVLLPVDTGYTDGQDSYWSNGAKIKPAFIVRPRSAEEVSAAVKALVAAGEKFAIRSGGHTQWAGSNNMEGGVTIDLSLLNWTRFDEASELVDLGPGGPCVNICRAWACCCRWPGWQCPCGRQRSNQLHQLHIFCLC
ncbi:hypothetical protein POJ06DRAFT_261993 [Lipomyces tetrasporus]|uniref:FAD-binding PCMH-type domain-containing protein n=1 Tax=Lipomyces tetrasporus TaxID=54092 RepID=A0AAD7QMC5_9ASCO|nr:uncharacterized protein POJ06DRAFT_261993 [Lipomyces tetrasporus]KAJ8097650.1 hypothetical protein POJ06DRAFT_261993 [Lipomyces tetrasporus]